jgi:hypothetical protein
VLTGAWPVILANAVTLGLASLILVTTWRGRRARASAQQVPKDTPIRPR